MSCAVAEVLGGGWITAEARVVDDLGTVYSVLRDCE